MALDTREKEQLYKKAKEFASSEKGKKSAEKAFKIAKEFNEKLDKSTKIDPKKLHEPITL